MMMAQTRPKILVTRKLPPTVEARLAQIFEARLLHQTSVKRNLIVAPLAKILFGSRRIDVCVEKSLVLLLFGA